MDEQPSITFERGDDADALFSALPIPEMAKQDLARRMAEPSRHYHARNHIELLWRRHRRFGPEADLGSRHQPLIAMAIAFHDAVYVGGAADNEARSAALWLEVSANGTVCAEMDRIWVADTILATADHLRDGARLDLADSRSRARQWVLDLDLTPLGDEPAVFDANMDDLAAELPDMPIAERKASLLAALGRFATAQPLYRCAVLRAAFEASAQNNLARHLRKPADAVQLK